MKHLDLCSGIGGFALAASWVWPDHEILSFVEIDEYCQKVLRRHWPDVPIHDDCNTFDARPFLGRVDILTGGYPCQPFSMAGKRQGAEDDRHLWPEVFRITRECRPRWCLFENVAGHVTMGLDSVLADLEGIGYTCAATVIPACAVDAKHRRDRVWILAYAECRAVQRQRGSGVMAKETRTTEGERHQWERGGDAAGDRSEAVANSESEREMSIQQQRRLCSSFEGREALGNADGTPENAFPAQGGPRRTTGESSKWLPEPDVGRVADGIPARVDRLRALGNAVVPQVAAEIMRAIPTE